jgi:hypothetical protein
MSDDREPAWLVYDDCGFCSWWAAFAADHTDLGIAGFSALTDDEVLSCGAAIEAVLDRAGVLPRELRLLLNQTADYGPLRERLYRAAADRRSLWGQFVSSEPPTRREPTG